MKVVKAVEVVEDRLEHTKVVHHIEEKTHHLAIVKKIVHGLAILLVPGFLLGTCIYYAASIFRK